MKPLVGVMPLWDDEKDSLWMLPGYLEGLKEAGATPVILPLTEDREEMTAEAELRRFRRQPTSVSEERRRPLNPRLQRHRSKPLMLLQKLQSKSRQS